MNETEAIRAATKDLVHAREQEQDFASRYERAQMDYARGSLRFELLKEAAENYVEAIRIAVEAHEALAEAAAVALWNAVPDEERTWRTTPPKVQAAVADGRKKEPVVH